ncbi:hypothetical protein EJ05DRAFT_531830 [Pseudovirgaria hyperparasitica]|uniref:Gfd2/YDR514C-like C-terminal domain-containing protein n=1 Tax=Pseudovirgaria hyperparasitica TaxID=470096 RepID=A0A6A6W768_9PEZI|nr:uncharacterized protein EJ05DRAFT_531830 [Pseudovirgaria hyperparasitica]KAF2758049.1 hypothetical protein EJ05DRAFT_531830 [Pseudovirgaria hyperparasitica]
MPPSGWALLQETIRAELELLPDRPTPSQILPPPKQAAASPFDNSTKSASSCTRVPDCSLARGELAPLNQTFCPILLFSKFPYWFISREFSERVADAFFNGGKFWERTWDLYYFWAPEAAKPLFFITELQAQLLINEINEKFKDTGLQVVLSASQRRESGLIIDFYEPHPHLRPRYLGRSHTRDENQNMTINAPSATFRPRHEAEVSPPDDNELEAFKEWYEEQAQKQKSKSKTLKAKKKEERIIIQKGCVKQLKRTQRYLGLRPKKPIQPLHDPALSSFTPAEREAAQAQWEIDTFIPPLNVLEPTPYDFENSVVFIAIDVEAWERNHKVITEVGVSTLDTMDLINVAPGKDGEEWRKKIRTRHIWIKENMHLRNQDFVHGCPERFEFGTSEQITMNEARREIAACFRPPYSSTTRPDSTIERNIIVVGHDPNQDIRYLASMGSNPLDNRANILEILDTATVYKTWKRETQSTSLGSILYNFGIVGWNLHNAGNDAHYTMEALVAMAVREATLHGTKALEQQRDLEKATKILEATTLAAVEAEERLEGWSSAGEDGGGGRGARRGGGPPRTRGFSQQQGSQRTDSEQMVKPGYMASTSQEQDWSGLNAAMTSPRPNERS